MNGFGMFNLMSFIFPLFFLVFFGLLIFSVVRGVKKWSYNNKQPIIPVQATIVSKRMSVSHHDHHDANTNMNSTSTSTTYYITFEFSNGERVEFVVSGYDYGMMVEGDKGTLTFQGTRFKGFVREF
ncbi:DUF2500 domain-containing protein [Clostridium intestinale]|nr:DUF2500 domain-containing protein [Clostridium intestinale]